MQSPLSVVSTKLTASVIVRSKDKQATIGRTLHALREQSVPAQIIVVDSGSTDRTVEIARSYDADIIEIPAADFSYGRALNLGAQHAHGDVLFALSAHSAPNNDRWIEWSLEAYQDPTVAATFGHTLGPDGRAIAGPTRVVAADLNLDRHLTWGLSNHASSWRHTVWNEFHFNEDLIACEDKEWMWRVLGAGYALVVDPRLYVDGSHRWGQGAKALYRRTYREHSALAELVEIETRSARGLLEQWWSDFPYPSERPMWQRRLSPMRNTELVAEFFGSRAGARHRGPHTLLRDSWNRPPTTRSSGRSN